MCGLRRGGEVQGLRAGQSGGLPAFGRPVRLVGDKWRWRCLATGCAWGSFTEVAEPIALARLARRGGSALA